MKDLAGDLNRMAERGTVIGSETLRQRVALELAGSRVVPESRERRWLRGPVLAAAVAVAVLIAFGGVMLLVARSDPDTDAATTVAPTTATPTTQAPVTTAAPTTATPTTQAPVTTADAAPATTEGAVATPAMEWERLPAQAAFEPGFIEAVVVGGPGLVAVGGIEDVRSEYLTDAAVWTSADGHEWVRIENPELFEAAGAIVDIAASPAGLIGVGTTSNRDGVVWRSPDGTTWERIDDPALAGPGAQEIVAVVAGSGGLVAVGNGERETLVWISPDGTSWTRVEDQSLQVSPTIQDLVAGDFGYLMVGSEFVSDSVMAPAMWVSSDGLEWERIPGDIFVGDDPAAVVTALLGATVGPTGDLLVWDNQGGLWRSASGIDWRPAADSEPPPAQLRAAAWDDTLVVGVGTGQGFFHPNAVMLVSPDAGLTWETSHVDNTAAAASIIGFGSDFFAFGWDLADPSEPGGPVLWIGTLAD